MLVMKDIIKIYRNGFLELKALDQVSLTKIRGEILSYVYTHVTQFTKDALR